MSHAPLPSLFTAGTLFEGYTPTLSPLPFGVHAIDSAIGGLAFGAIHEWSLNGYPTPPFLVLSTLLQQALKSDRQRNLILWVGERCWPSLFLLEQLQTRANWSWQQNTLFLQATSRGERLATLRSCLSSKSVLAVIGDASGFHLTATRQLLLAARKGETLGLLFRPEQELSMPSCARTRWLVQPSLEEHNPHLWKGNPTWRLSLKRAPGITHPQEWLLAWDDERQTLETLTAHPPLKEALYANQK